MGVAHRREVGGGAVKDEMMHRGWKCKGGQEEGKKECEEEECRMVRAERTDRRTDRMRVFTRRVEATQPVEVKERLWL